jgi:hypothetical protein
MKPFLLSLLVALLPIWGCHGKLAGHGRLSDFRESGAGSWKPRELDTPATVQKWSKEKKGGKHVHFHMGKKKDKGPVDKLDDGWFDDDFRIFVDDDHFTDDRFNDDDDYPIEGDEFLDGLCSVLNIFSNFVDLQVLLGGNAYNDTNVLNLACPVFGPVNKWFCPPPEVHCFPGAPIDYFVNGDYCHDIFSFIPDTDRSRACIEECITFVSADFAACCNFDCPQ